MGGQSESDETNNGVREDRGEKVVRGVCVCEDDKGDVLDMLTVKAAMFVNVCCVVAMRDEVTSRGSRLLLMMNDCRERGDGTYSEVFSFSSFPLWQVVFFCHGCAGGVRGSWFPATVDIQMHRDVDV